MEGRRDVAAGAAAQGLARWRRCGGEESDGSSSGVELSLRLRTGDGSSAPPPAMAEEARRKNMTIFYNGRVCAVDVTEVQARAIISMANEEMIMAAADHHHQQWHNQRDSRHLQDSGSGGGAMARCHVARPAAGSSRQGFAAAPVIDPQAAVSGLSMKRSLQRFLQKRKDRTAGAVAPPYAGARQAQAMRH